MKENSHEMHDKKNVLTNLINHQKTRRKETHLSKASSNHSEQGHKILKLITRSLEKHTGTEMY